MQKYMSLYHYDPFSVRPYFDLTKFNDSSSSGSVDDYVLPAVDIREDVDCYTIHVDLPGVKSSDIDITIKDGSLSVEAHREFSSRSKEEGYQRTERGSFYRQFAFPKGVKPNSCEASYQDGVLKLVLPKQDEVKPYKVAVQNAA